MVCTVKLDWVSMGHQVQEKQGLQSTTQLVDLKSSTYQTTLKSIKEKFVKLKENHPSTSLDNLVKRDIEHDAFPISPVPNIRTNDVIYSLVSRQDIYMCSF